MGSTPPGRAGVGRPEWEADDAPPSRPNSPPSLLIVAAGMVLLGVLGLFLVARTDTAVERSVPPTTATPSTTIRSNTRTSVIADLDGPLLPTQTGAVVISTDFDGRLVALELDSGVVTRTSIRSGRFVSVDGELVVQTGCGSWRTVDVRRYTLTDQLIACGSYQPIVQRGADVVLFGRPGQGGTDDVLLVDGDGGVVAGPTTDLDPAAYATVSDRRLLVETADARLGWIDTATGEFSPYTEGRLIEAGPGGVLWSTCDDPGRCGVWFGTPDDARVHRYPIEAVDGRHVARINDIGTRAVFFLNDDVLRIITLETGHARQVANPGINHSTATWSPDGLWLLDPTGAEVIALNTLNGRTARFDGIPGDVSPGWVAVLESP